jgi:hypothetical protein
MPEFGSQVWATASPHQFVHAWEPVYCPQADQIALVHVCFPMHVVLPFGPRQTFVNVLAAGVPGALSM